MLFPQLNLLNPPKKNSWVRHCKNSCIMLVVIYNYTSDARTHESQTAQIMLSFILVSCSEGSWIWKYSKLKPENWINPIIHFLRVFRRPRTETLSYPCVLQPHDQRRKRRATRNAAKVQISDTLTQPIDWLFSICDRPASSFINKHPLWIPKSRRVAI
jgi:hypothetical protein